MEGGGGTRDSPPNPSPNDPCWEGTSESPLNSQRLVSICCHGFLSLSSGWTRSPRVLERAVGPAPVPLCHGCLCTRHWFGLLQHLQNVSRYNEEEGLKLNMPGFNWLGRLPLLPIARVQQLCNRNILCTLSYMIFNTISWVCHDVAPTHSAFPLQLVPAREFRYKTQLGASHDLVLQWTCIRTT